MKEEFNQAWDAEDLDPRSNDHEEVGIALTEHFGDDDRRQNESENNDEHDEYDFSNEFEDDLDDKKEEKENEEEDFFPSDDDYEIEEEEPEEAKMDEEPSEFDEIEGEESQKEKKETLLDKIKGNLIYILVALVLIIPAAFKLYGVIFGSAAAPVSKTAAPVGFTQESSSTEKPKAVASKSSPATPEAAVPTEQAPAHNKSAPALPYGSLEAPHHAPMTEQATPPISAPVVEEPAPVSPSAVENQEAAPAEDHASRSLLDTWLSVGDGSESNSDNMENVAAETGSNVDLRQQAGSEDILNRYSEQENKVQEQLTVLQNRVVEVESKMGAFGEVDNRISALQQNTEKDASNLEEQLQALSNKVTMLEQGLSQLKQQQAVAMAKVVPETTAARASRVAAPAIVVEAVIPGRAWVRNEQGILMVVEVGDEIAGVGKVTRIDARQGSVATATQVFKQ